MGKTPWITIIGIGEDGPAGLSSASQTALAKADVFMGPPRHLALVPEGSAQRIEWPVPFADGIEILRGLRGQRVAVLASGDPFWFGAGTVIARHFARDEWTCLPAPSSFSLVAAHLGWPLESTLCLGLHAKPLSTLRRHLSKGQRAIVTLRDVAAVSDLADLLTQAGFGASDLWIAEALAGPTQRVTQAKANAVPHTAFAHPLCIAIEMTGPASPRSSGRPDHLFETDGVMTKGPIRAMTLSALAPCPGETLWDIGAGSGSIAVEWMLAHPTCHAIAIEPRSDRCALIRQNADNFGVPALHIVEGNAPDALTDLPHPDAVFIGGGLDRDLIDWLDATLPRGTRMVANAVTLDSEALLTEWASQKTGDLLRIDLSTAKPLGAKQAWSAAYPIVQWSGVL